MVFADDGDDERTDHERDSRDPLQQQHNWGGKATFLGADTFFRFHLIISTHWKSIRSDKQHLKGYLLP